MDTVSPTPKQKMLAAYSTFRKKAQGAARTFHQTAVNIHGKIDQRKADAIRKRIQSS